MEDNDINKEILAELKYISRAQKTQRKSAIISVIFLIIIIPMLVLLADENEETAENEPAVTESWDEVDSLDNSNNTQQALDMALRLRDKLPHDFFGYTKSAELLNRLGRDVEAEINYQKAYDLWPSKDNYDNLSVIQLKLQRMNENKFKAEN